MDNNVNEMQFESERYGLLAFIPTRKKGFTVTACDACCLDPWSAKAPSAFHGKGLTESRAIMAIKIKGRGNRRLDR